MLRYRDGAVSDCRELAQSSAHPAHPDVTFARSVQWAHTRLTRSALAEHPAVGLVGLGSVFGRHVMDLHPGVRSLPLFGEGRVPGGLECGSEIHSTPRWTFALVARDITIPSVVSYSESSSEYFFMSLSKHVSLS